MSKYRFKTKQELIRDGQWDYENNIPVGWNNNGYMNHFLGSDIPKEMNEKCDGGSDLNIDGWFFAPADYVLKEENEINANGFEYFGDKLMEVSANNNWWFPRVVFGKKGGSYLAWSDAKTLEEAKNAYNSSWWKYARPIKTKLTLKQVADKFGLK